MKTKTKRRPLLARAGDRIVLRVQLRCPSCGALSAKVALDGTVKACGDCFLLYFGDSPRCESAQKSEKGAISE